MATNDFIKRLMAKERTANPLKSILLLMLEPGERPDCLSEPCRSCSTLSEQMKSNEGLITAISCCPAAKNILSLNSWEEFSIT